MAREGLLQRQNRNKASLVLQKGGCLKTIFKRNNRGKFTLFLLFSLSILAFAVLLLCQIVFHMNISLLALTCTLIGITFFGGLLIQIRSGPPW